MHILVVNPNTTASMTDKIGAAAQAVAGQDTRITAVNPDTGPAAIQGAEDGAAALPGLFALFDAAMASDETYDAVIIACFDDTGLWPLKARSPVPVLGIGEAGYHAAMLVAQRFSVVTTLAASLPVIEANIADAGFAARCARVRASDVPVLDLEDPRSGARGRIAREIAAAITEDAPQAIILGCAGMADLARSLSDEFRLPVIDGVAAAVTFAQALHGAGISAPASFAPAETRPVA
ncbi:aspartate/glutamate racemase family protein [Breoghania sp. L-A4]|uniref:aspartate/glutamate racemase family protein n=1 Tax=Breoghania sp. L-A4 TaxID=2304600 RepID=UPI000E35D492|nr:aspartate/glutamate racemase family protein [Breoghania sp. L-A4]AXS41696.1 aspartate/glutamate racemase family protein [Breoghania sp. L-A4]